MTAWGTWVVVIACVPVLLRVWHGWRDGATVEMRHVIMGLFALLAALHFWKPLTVIAQRGIAIDPRLLAIAAFAVLYIAAAAAASFAVRLKAETYSNVRFDPMNKGLGLMAGLFSGSLMGAVLAMLLVFAIPTRFEDPETSRIPLGIADWPVKIYRSFESNVARVERGSPSRTQMPKIEFDQQPVPGNSQQAQGADAGTVVVQFKPRLIWQ